ncbi:alpha/beta fold hydrolase [Halomarina litorea]|uniref:alpha/beta fold hydrolase n=1 Tax=Halomarina litorea TaxID=2961595 RepID=UPI0020C45743|nr:alpha/beta hydrolase [Halomarina sp. BCD28]
MTTVALDDTTLWYDETGEGRPLVFVHGGWSNAHAWTPQVESFADEYRVIRLDVRGHGRTGATDEERYSIDLFTDDLERLLDHLNVESPLLCGLSLGGMVVQNYLDRHPDRAAGALLAGPVRSMPPVDMPTWVKPFCSPLPALAGSLATMGSEATFRSMLAGITVTTGSRWLSIDPSVRRAAIATAGEVDPDEFHKVFAALYRFDPPDLSHVETPVALVFGDHEAPLVKYQGRRLAAEVGASVTEIPDAGHLVNLDAPSAFDETLADLLADLDAPRAGAASD